MPNLQILIGHLEGELSSVDSYFNDCYTLEWFESDLAKDILRDICGYKGHVGHAITVRSIFNENEDITIAMRELPSGVKALLIMLNTDEEFVSATRCGENCIKWIVEISKSKPLKITINYCVDFGDTEILVLNDNSIVRTAKDYSDKYYEYETSIYDENFNLIDKFEYD